MQLVPTTRNWNSRELIDTGERYIVYELRENVVSGVSLHLLSNVDSCSLLQSLCSPLGMTEKQNTAQPNYTFLTILISLFPCGFYRRVLNYTKCLFFCSWGGGDLCACGEETDVALNYSCLKPQPNIRKITLWLCFLVRACSSALLISATSSVLQNKVGYSIK